VKPSESKQSSGKQSDSKQSESKQSEVKPSESKQSSGKQSESKQSESKQSSDKQSESQQSEPSKGTITTPPVGSAPPVVPVVVEPRLAVAQVELTQGGGETPPEHDLAEIRALGQFGDVHVALNPLPAHRLELLAKRALHQVILPFDFTHVVLMGAVGLWINWDWLIGIKPVGINRSLFIK
jgi:DNA mismatch repair ATPase MutL